MIKRTQGWRNVEEGIHQIIKQYSHGGNDILIALINVSAGLLYHAGGYRSGDKIDWFKRAIEEQITHIQTQEETRAKYERKDHKVDFSRLLK